MMDSDAESINTFQMDEMCRTCLRKVDVPINIFKYLIEGKLISNILETCTTIRVDAEDRRLPQKMCSKCLVSLAEAYSFSQKCLTTDELLKTILDTAEQNNSFKEELTDDENQFIIDETELLLIRDASEDENSLIAHDTDHDYEIMRTKDSETPDLTEKLEQLNYTAEKASLCLHKTKHTSDGERSIEKLSVSGNVKHSKVTFSGESMYVCEFCSKAFMNPSNLSNHRKLHTLRKKYTCEVCNETFKVSNALVTHVLNEHSDHPGQDAARQLQERPYECQICLCRFKTKVLLANHMNCHGERKYLCDDCGKRFKTRLALKLHIRIHTGEKPHKCEACGKMFAQASSLAYHKRVHTGERPYECCLCSKAFTQAAHLKTHMKTHTGERPFKCPYCDKAFALKKNMIVHSRMHTGEKPYSCPVCEKKFYDSSSMKKHHRMHKRTMKVEFVESTQEDFAIM